MGAHGPHQTEMVDFEEVEWTETSVDSQLFSLEQMRPKLHGFFVIFVS